MLGRVLRSRGLINSSSDGCKRTSCQLGALLNLSRCHEAGEPHQAAGDRGPFLGYAVSAGALRLTRARLTEAMTWCSCPETSRSRSSRAN